jgi:ABC-type dipeptide/oligopeptide/nickel transport system permease subunit
MTNRTRSLTSSRSRWSTLRRFARQSPIGTISALVLLLALAVALIGPFITRVGDPQAINPMAMFASPSADYPMGADDLGRSVFARLVFALRISFALATISALLAATLGTLLGLVAGYTGGLLDEIFMRITDMLFAFPTLLLAILIAAVLGPGISGVVITIVVATVPVFSRVARGPTLSVRASEYAVASRVIGASPGTNPLSARATQRHDTAPGPARLHALGGAGCRRSAQFPRPGRTAADAVPRFPPLQRQDLHGDRPMDDALSRSHPGGGDPRDQPAGR